MKKILIIGAGGLGKEVADLIRYLNQYEIEGFLDDDPGKKDTLVNQLPVLGTVLDLEKYCDTKHIVIAIANPGVKKKIAKVAVNAGFRFPNLIHPSVVLGNNVTLGQGNIICAGVILSTESCLNDFITINPQCGIGHESTLCSYSTLYWGVHIGGNTIVNEACELGTHSCVLQGLHIAEKVVLGAGAVVVKSIDTCGTYVGIPAKKLEP